MSDKDIDLTIDEAEKDSAQTYDEYRAEVETEQSGMSKQEIMEMMRQRNEHAIDLDNLQSVTINHRWVDRGMFLSCEEGSHASHRHAKRR